MPEAPDLEVVREFLEARAVGAQVERAEVVRPGVLRSLCGDMPADAAGRELAAVERRGKFLTLRLSGDRRLVVNPMLAGAFQYCAPGERRFKRTFFTITLSNGREIRYLDERQMGRAYYLAEDQLDQVPGLHEQGLDVLDGHSFDEFRERLRPFRGEIKGVITRGRVVAGVGNAYADEVLFEAGIYPFRKVKALSEDELKRLHRKLTEVVERAIEVLRERMGERTHVKLRDFLLVHNKGGSPCPRCGNAISQLTANRRITSYCRRCQPGMLLRN